MTGRKELSSNEMGEATDGAWFSWVLKLGEGRIRSLALNMLNLRLSMRNISGDA